jgi:hypothetical protein
MDEPLTPDHFRPHVDKAFRVEGRDHLLTLTRIEMRRQEQWESTLGFRAPFNLIFRGPPGDVLPEGFYRLVAEGAPAFELYVIPIHTPARDRQDYQAAFN